MDSTDKEHNARRCPVLKSKMMSELVALLYMC